MKQTWAITIFALLLSGCAGSASTETSQTPASVSSQAAEKNDSTTAAPVNRVVSSDDKLRDSQKDAAIMIYESWPLETSLDNAHIADVIPVWLEAIEGAEKTLDFSEYYAISEPNTGLEKVVNALKRAASRGVKIRFLIDEKLNTDKNAVLPEELASIQNLELRKIDYSKVTGGGVQHSKYFIVDGKTAYYGSQNFDWRSLEHISEMGARLRPAELVEPLKQLFEIDWALAANYDAAIPQATCSGAIETDYKGEKTTVELVASPPKSLPCQEMWDLPKMLALIGNAKTSVSVQLLNYATKNYDKTVFMELDDALTAAAKRGVHVRLMVSDWSTKPKNMSDMKRLAAIENIDVRMIEIPEHSMGFVPYSRTIHSKFMVVDDADTWLGTSNWAGDYFYKSRNVGIIAHGKTLNDELTRSFNHYWESDYAIVVDPNIDYPVKNQAKPSK